MNPMAREAVMDSIKRTLTLGFLLLLTASLMPLTAGADRVSRRRTNAPNP